MVRRLPPGFFRTFQNCTDQRSYSTVRKQLRVLELKGHLKRQKRGGLYMYSPAVPRRLARRHALRHVLETYFDGSLEEALTFALTAGSFRLENGARQRLAALCTSEDIREAAGRGDANQALLHGQKPRHRRVTR